MMENTPKEMFDCLPKVKPITREEYIAAFAAFKECMDAKVAERLRDLNQQDYNRPQ